MKKNGFTLAEVLVTLGIIGVVAALAMPALNSAVQKTKVGPTLRKFITTLENGNERILQEEDADTLIGLSGESSPGSKYLSILSKYVKGERKTSDVSISNYAGTKKMMDKNGVNVFEFADDSMMYIDPYSARDSRNPSGAYKGAVADIYYDINGFKASPNKYGRDVFIFRLDNTGTIIPAGGKLEYSAYTDQTNTQAWKSSSGKCNETTVGDGRNCAGSIADNNWKVTYKY